MNENSSVHMRDREEPGDEAQAPNQEQSATEMMGGDCTSKMCSATSKGPILMDVIERENIQVDATILPGACAIVPGHGLDDSSCNRKWESGNPGDGTTMMSSANTNTHPIASELTLTDRRMEHGPVDTSPHPRVHAKATQRQREGDGLCDKWWIGEDPGEAAQALTPALSPTKGMDERGAVAMHTGRRSLVVRRRNSTKAPPGQGDDTMLRPGAYAKAPGQSMVFQQTVAYERAYRRSSSISTELTVDSTDSSAFFLANPSIRTGESGGIPDQHACIIADSCSVSLHRDLAYTYTRKMAIRLALECDTGEVDIEQQSVHPEHDISHSSMTSYTPYGQFHEEEPEDQLSLHFRTLAEQGEHHSAENLPQDSIPPPLPVAAEVVESPEATEREIQRRLSLERVEDYSVAELVPPGLLKSKRALTFTLCSMVAIIVVVWIVFAARILRGAYSESGPDYTMPSVEDDRSGEPSSPTQQGRRQPTDDTILASIPETICYERAPLMGASHACPPQPLGSAASNLVAASRLWSVPEATISILNAGEVQADMEGGDFSMGKARAILPYPNNTLVTLQLEGYQLVSVLERALERLVNDLQLQQIFGDSGVLSGTSYPYAARIRFHVNMTQPFPQRLSKIQVRAGGPSSLQDALWESLVLRGKPYSIVTSHYLANGGDGYHEFSQVKTHDTGLRSLDQFAFFCQHQGVLRRPSPQEFSTQSYVGALLY